MKSHSLNRRHFLGALAGSAASPVLLQAQNESTPAADHPSLVRTPLVLAAPRPDGAEAVWAVNQLSKAKIEWEREDGSSGVIASNRFGFVPQGDEVLRVRLDGFKPGRNYRIRSVTIATADGKEEISPWKKLRTIDPSAKSSRFVVWNDTHINNETIRKLDEVTPSADFLFWNGDTCNDWKSEDLLIPTLLHPGERDITDGRPLFVAWGNHDVRGPHAFVMPHLIPTPNGRPFYAFRSGPVAVICLHTGEDKPDDHPSFGGRVAFDALRAEQAEWLKEAIRQPELRDAPYRIVFCHIPLRWQTERVPDYANGGFDHVSLRSRGAWHESLVAWKTQLVISGHTHRDAFMPANDDFPYAQVTGGGPQPARATWMTAEASADEFNLEVKSLEGATRHAISLKPLV